jgi:hypothetical protein
MFPSRDYESEPWALQMDELLEVMGVQDKTMPPPASPSSPSVSAGQPITELTTFYDFFFSQKEWVKLRATINELYYVNIDIDDYLWEVSEKIHDAQRQRAKLKKRLG